MLPKSSPRNSPRHSPIPRVVNRAPAVPSSIQNLPLPPPPPPPAPAPLTTNEPPPAPPIPPMPPLLVDQNSNSISCAGSTCNQPSNIPGNHFLQLFIDQ